MQHRTCRLVTLGCKVNQYETQLVKEGSRTERLPRSGRRRIGRSVRRQHVHGDRNGRLQIAAGHPAARPPESGNADARHGLLCDRDPQAVAQLPGVFEVVRDKRELPDVLSRQGIVDIPRGISHFDGRKRAYVKVQDGCILKCTYCIIPQVRPGLASRSPVDIEEEVRRLIGNGYREIVLTGIHVGHYGVDTTRGKSGLAPFRLWHLFRRLDRIGGEWRMRLSSIEVAEVNDDFISAAADCEHLCPQFHPALQSGSETVLRRMRRRYSVRRFLERIEQMRERFVHPAFTTDMIVGFPGETEDEFEQSLEACRRVGFMKIHIFPLVPAPARKRPNSPTRCRQPRFASESTEWRCSSAIWCFSIIGALTENRSKSWSSSSPKTGPVTFPAPTVATYRWKFPAPRRTSGNSFRVWENKHSTATCAVRRD